MEREVTGRINHHSLVLLVCAHPLLFPLGGETQPERRDRRQTDGGREGDRRRRGSLLHARLVLLVCADLLAGVFALLAPLALLVFVPPVAVALLAVVPPPATAANPRRRTEGWKRAEEVREGRGNRSEGE